MTIHHIPLYWHINESNILIHIALYFIVCFFSILAIILLWRCADRFKSHIIIYISIGTMVIFGLHRMLFGSIGYGIERFFHMETTIYTWFETVLITIAIEAILIPFIVISLIPREETNLSKDSLHMGMI